MAHFAAPHTVGTIQGRDHQYWPTILRSDLRPILAAQLGLIGTNDQNRFMDRVWPVAVNLEVLMHFAWRVREWRVDASSFTFTGFKSISPLFTWTISGDLPEMILKMRRVKSPADIDDPHREVRDEADILGPASDWNLSFTGGTDKDKTLRNAGVTDAADSDDIDLTGSDTGGGPPPVLAPPFREPGGNYSGRLLGGYVIYDPAAKLFYPPVAVGGDFDRFKDIGGGSTSGAKVSIYCLATAQSATPPETPQGTLTIVNPIIGEPDIVIPLGMFGGPGGSAPPSWPNGGTGSINLTITPVRWWQHWNSLGQPIYVEATGAPTGNDPLA